MRCTWSTRQVRSSEQCEYWRDVICDAFLPLEPVLPRARAFEGSVDAVALRSFHLASVSAHAHTVKRTKAGIAHRRTGGFFANLIRSGSASATQAGNHAEAVAGDIVLFDTDEPFEFRMFGACDVVCLTIPEDRLRRRLGPRGLPRSPVIAGRSVAGRLASRYLELLRAEPERDLLEVEDAVFDHVCHLLARGAAPAAQGSTGHAALRARITDYIDEHLNDDSLCAAAVSRALGISRSHLYALLAQGRMPFASEVRERRLRAADRALREPRYADLTIAEIAQRSGFDDASGFSRAYRRRFDAAPRSRRTPPAADETAD